MNAPGSTDAAPSVTTVFLVYNRREELRESLQRMLDSDYEGDLDFIVVDNASEDGSGQMVRQDFPDVRLITHERNVGVSGWNIGFAQAQGDWVLALDDDCYLPPDGLRKAVTAAQEHEADLVSFRVVSTHDPDYFFDDEFDPGLFSFWGCSTLFRREVIQELGGYDPEVFIWANELELTIRFYDRGYRHLHYPEVVAQHMKKPAEWRPPRETDMRPRRINNRHHGYIAAKLLQPRNAAGALVAMVTTQLRDGFRLNWRCAAAAPQVVIGFLNGLRHRRPVRPEVSRAYRLHYWEFASPWWLSRSPADLIRALPREIATRRITNGRRPQTPSRGDEYFASRARFYPEGSGTLTL